MPVPGNGIGYIGVRLSELNDKLRSELHYDGPKGVAVVQVIRGGPADRAGLEPGDVITTINGDRVMTPADAVSRIQRISIGETAVMQVWSAGSKRLVIAKVVERPANLVDVSPTQTSVAQAAVRAQATNGSQTSISPEQALNDFAQEKVVGHRYCVAGECDDYTSLTFAACRMFAATSSIAGGETTVDVWESRPPASSLHAAPVRRVGNIFYGATISFHGNDGEFVQTVNGVRQPPLAADDLPVPFSTYDDAWQFLHLLVNWQRSCGVSTAQMPSSSVKVVSASTPSSSAQWQCHFGCKAVQIDFAPNGPFDGALFGGYMYSNGQPAGQGRPVELHGTMNGSTISGSALLPGGDSVQGGCVTPRVFSSTFTGQLSGDGNTLTLTIMVPSWHIEARRTIFGPMCSSITADGVNPVTVILVR